MSRTQLDYASIREQARFETVLADYGLEMRGHGVERVVFCPFHDDGSPSCSVNLEKKIFHCFACGEKGTILDFVSRMEPCTISDAARLLADQCNVSGPFAARAGTAKARSESLSPNVPLGFELPLDPNHPYLQERGISLSTISKFGLGYCDRGIMKGRICIPILDKCGRLVAYAGRWPGSNPPAGQPRYRFPRGFKKRLLLFNFHSVAEATHLVVVEGFWSVFRLDALGIAAVALMGCTLSEEQEGIIRCSSADSVTLLLDGDEAGRAATSEIQSRLERHLFVHAPDLAEGVEPDTMDQDMLLAAIRKPTRN